MILIFHSPDLKNSERNRLYPYDPRNLGGGLGTFGGLHEGRGDSELLD